MYLKKRLEEEIILPSAVDKAVFQWAVDAPDSSDCLKAVQCQLLQSCRQGSITVSITLPDGLHTILSSHHYCDCTKRSWFHPTKLHFQILTGEYVNKINSNKNEVEIIKLITISNLFVLWPKKRELIIMLHGGTIWTMAVPFCIIVKYAVWAIPVSWHLRMTLIINKNILVSFLNLLFEINFNQVC